MAVSDTVWENWLERLYNLRRDKSGSHERPHKPVLLLSIIDLLDHGLITRNEVPLSEELVATFKGYFAVVRRENDQPTIQNPFFHLCGDKFWRLVPVAGERDIYQAGAAAGAPSVAELRRRVAYGKFDDGMWQLLNDPMSRHQLREALIARYFPDDREKLAAITAAGRTAEPVASLREEMPPGRDGAFRRTILEIYDYTCAACGSRVKLNDGFCLADAAHIIPWDETRNDKPDNGMALCPNHHRAMDRRLIAPCPHPEHRAGVWQISKRLEPRIDGHKDLVNLRGQPVIPPGEEKFYPALESLRWREEHLIKA